LSKTRVEIIAEHIRTTVDAVNTHDDPRHSRLYTQGFILGHMASIFSTDPILYREFLEHCEYLAKPHNKKIDMHRK
jgi:hypothetical protein